MKNFKVIVISIFLYLFTGGWNKDDCKAQNLVSNGGFETSSAFPAGPGEWWKVTGWNDVNNWPSFSWPYPSPDYLSINGTGSAKLPASVFGNINPFSGTSVMGFVAYYNPSAPEFREYLSSVLSAPMVVGKTYDVSFMLSNGNSNQYCGSGCNHIGVCFSVSPLTQIQHEPINVTPQCEISTVWWSSSWRLVSFTYTATSSFRYITLGNFYNDASTAHTVFNAASASANGAYYFIDEVAVMEVVPLPVELIAFDGYNRGGINILKWSTASEMNNDHFELERSADGISFEKIGVVNGQNFSYQFSNYSFQDSFPYNGINYYRLKQVDLNGNYDYSGVISVNVRSVDMPGISVYPNPAKNEITLLTGTLNKMEVEIFDAAGSLMNAGTNVFQFDISAWASGIYFVRARQGDVYYLSKFIKQ